LRAQTLRKYGHPYERKKLSVCPVFVSAALAQDHDDVDLAGRHVLGWKTGGRAHIHAMRIRLSILLAAALLAAAILLVFRDEIHARNELVPQCGFWGDVEAGMSCR
jgi:hypothetical protein